MALVRLARGDRRSSGEAGEFGNAGQLGRRAYEMDVDEKILLGKDVVERLRRELILGYEAWAHWEALNGKSADHRREFRDAVDSLGLGASLAALKRILARDTILILCRITDSPSKERQTLCRLSGIMSDAQVREKLTSKSWLIQENWPDFLIERQLESRPRQFDRILQRVPPKWGDTPPIRPALFTLRNKLRPVRDRLLAHIIDDAEMEHARVREVRAFMTIVARLVMEADLLFLSHESKQWPVKLSEANRLWNHLSRVPSRQATLSNPITPEGSD